MIEEQLISGVGEIASEASGQVSEQVVVSQIIIPSLWVLLLMLGFMFSMPTLAASDVDGRLAPDFTLKSADGRNVRLSEFKGEVVLINFWATWCGPCRQEMPKLEEMYSRYKDMGFTILGVNVEKNSTEAIAMLKNKPVSFPVLFDSHSKVSELYQVDAMPMTVLVDRDGNMRHLHRGYKPGYEDEYVSQVKHLFREQYANTEFSD